MSKKNEETDQEKPAPGCSIDIGTMNLVSARCSPDGTTRIKQIRDAFIDIESSAKRSLKLSKVEYFEQDGVLIVIGDSALTMANLFKREARRPLSKGVISAGEHDAQGILSLLIHNVLGDPVVSGEHCFYSVPAAPLDDLGQDVVYHREIFRKILSEYDYTAHPVNEAMAIIYSECAPEVFSGLGVSFGAGMVNVALAYQATEAMTFSLARGGDWIDAHAARAVGRTASQMCAIKERGFDLASPKGREQEALALYIRALIDYCLGNIAAQFKKEANSVTLLEPIPLVVSGGTSRIKGFLSVFQSCLKEIQQKGFPIEISEVRPAENPMTAVAQGLLVLAAQEYEVD